jgi:hypothetical protein
MVAMRKVAVLLALGSEGVLALGTQSEPGPAGTLETGH